LLEIQIGVTESISHYLLGIAEISTIKRVFEIKTL